MSRYRAFVEGKVWEIEAEDMLRALDSCEQLLSLALKWKEIDKDKIKVFGLEELGENEKIGS